jgi:hypothetical protein
MFESCYTHTVSMQCSSHATYTLSACNVRVMWRTHTVSIIWEWRPSLISVGGNGRVVPIDCQHYMGGIRTGATTRTCLSYIPMHLLVSFLEIIQYIRKIYHYICFDSFGYELKKLSVHCVILVVAYAKVCKQVFKCITKWVETLWQVFVIITLYKLMLYRIS